MNMQTKQAGPLIVSGRDATAVLGPTNTGKTHLAIERMVAHQSGVIGLPLRLLAREVYSRVVEKVGAANVALVTGEEKIVPAGARYTVCTVEAMPRQTDAAFVAIDEVQLAADLERGHIFTDRILHLRGRQETLLLGAGTMQGILQKLLRGLSVVTRPRLSHLAYAGSKKLTRLPRRSAIVAFTADEVYAIAELIRRQRGGAAVVLGALSPRTRNAQVDIYQSGDVDYLVATDAIGMGLNLDVDHVAFAQNRKFDGYQYRQLTAAELGQIAGRAGRHVRDGTFGVTGQVDPFDDDLVERIEGHDFDPVRVLQWRSAEFDFAGIEALKHSLEALPPVEGLSRALPAADQTALDLLSKDPDIVRLADRPARVSLLWDTCALPDYRRIAPAQHAELVGAIFTDLTRRGHVDEDYMAEQVRRASSSEGDIDVLSARIAQIRTWTFVSHRPGWLADPTHWQEKTRDIEDRLSDALHERLTKRFVDRRTSVLMKRLRENTMLEAEISPAGEVLVEGHHVGELQGFRFTVDQAAEGEDAKAVQAAAQKALAKEFELRAERFANAPNGDLALSSDGLLRWIGAPVATLVAGDEPLKPRVVLLADEQLTGALRDRVQARAERYVAFQIETLLKPLLDLSGSELLAGIARGVAFRLVENFGLINRRDVAEDVRSLDQEARAAIRRLGVRFGAYHIFVPALLKPAPAGLLTLLWALRNDAKDRPGFGDVVHLLASGRTSVVVDPSFDKMFYRLAGYRNLGRRAVRVDILERLADLIRPALGWKEGVGVRPDGAYGDGAFIVTPAMMSILGATAEDMEEILKGLGYRGEAKPAAEVAGRIASLDATARAAAQAQAAEPAAQDHGDAMADPNVPATFAADATPQEGAAVETNAVDADANQPVSGPDLAAEPAAPDEASLSHDDVMADSNVSPAPAPADEIVPAEASARTATEAPDSAAATSAEPAPAAPPDATEAGIAQADAGSAAEEGPKPVIVWRQGRFGGRQRHGNRRGGELQGDRRGNRDTQRHGEGQNPRRFDRNGQGKGDFGERGRQAKGKRPQRDDNAKPFRERPREDRASRIDPDSPFAKLAALRDQLKK